VGTGPFDPDRERTPLHGPIATTLLVFVCIAIASLLGWRD